MNQSRPRRLRRDGAGRLARGAGGDVASVQRAPLRGPRSLGIGSIGRARAASYLSDSSLDRLQRLQAAGRAEHDDRRVFLVFRRGLDLIAWSVPA